MDTGFIIMLESRPNRVFGMTKRGHVEKDAVLDGVTHMDPQHHFSKPHVFDSSMYQKSRAYNERSRAVKTSAATHFCCCITGELTLKNNAAAVVVR